MNCSPLLASTLGLGEAWARYAVGMAYPLLEAPMDKASALGLAALPKLESVVPALQMTPEELAATGKARFYDGSLVQRSFQGLIAGPALAGQKAEAAKEMAALVATAGKDKARALIHTGLMAANLALDSAERYLDAVVGPLKDGETGPGLLHRIGALGSAAGEGLRARAASGVEASRSLLAREQAQAAALIAYVRGLGGRFSGSVSLASLRNAALAALKDLEAKAQALKVPSPTPPTLSSGRREVGVEGEAGGGAADVDQGDVGDRLQPHAQEPRLPPQGPGRPRQRRRLPRQPRSQHQGGTLPSPISVELLEGRWWLSDGVAGGGGLGDVEGGEGGEGGGGGEARPRPRGLLRHGAPLLDGLPFAHALS